MKRGVCPERTIIKKKAFGKTLYTRHNASEINWDIYWDMINSLGETIKFNRNPNFRSRGGWKWPVVDYDPPKIFRARFHRNGLVNKSYKEIAEEFNLDMINADQFISGIVTSMIRYMNAYSKRSKWSK